jgi:hypothetical protein
VSAPGPGRGRPRAHLGAGGHRADPGAAAATGGGPGRPGPFRAQLPCRGRGNPGLAGQRRQAPAQGPERACRRGGQDPPAAAQRTPCRSPEQVRTAARRLRGPRIPRGPLGPAEVRLIAMLATASFFEGYDLNVVMVALPAIRDSFGLRQAQASVTLTWTVLAEELPAGKRGYGFGVLAMLNAIGAGAAASLGTAAGPAPPVVALPVRGRRAGPPSGGLHPHDPGELPLHRGCVGGAACPHLAAPAASAAPPASGGHLRGGGTRQPAHPAIRVRHRFHADPASPVRYHRQPHPRGRRDSCPAGTGGRGHRQRPPRTQARRMLVPRPRASSARSASSCSPAAPPACSQRWRWPTPGSSAPGPR